MDDLDRLRRWVDSGAIWRVAGRTEHSITINLVTCTGDEVVDRFTSTDPDLIGYVGEHQSSEDLP